MSTNTNMPGEKRESQVQQQLNIANKAISEGHELACELQKRLSEVMRTEPPEAAICTKITAPEVLCVPIADRVRNCRFVAESTVALLRTILDRLEV